MAGQNGSLQLLLAGRADVNVADAQGHTALHHAAHLGHAGCVELLLSSGAVLPDLKAFGDDGSTALHKAAGAGHSDVVRAFIASRKCNLNARDNDGDTAAMMAADHAQTAVLRLLVACERADVAMPNDQGDTPLIVAASTPGEGGARAVAALLPACAAASINSRNSDGNTALHVAARNGHHLAAHVLLGSPALDVNAPNPATGETALIVAAARGHVEVCARRRPRALVWPAAARRPPPALRQCRPLVPAWVRRSAAGPAGCCLPSCATGRPLH